VLSWYKPAHFHLDSTQFNSWLIEYGTISIPDDRPWFSPSTFLLWIMHKNSKGKGILCYNWNIFTTWTVQWFDWKIGARYRGVHRYLLFGNREFIIGKWNHRFCRGIYSIFLLCHIQEIVLSIKKICWSFETHQPKQIKLNRFYIMWVWG